MANGRFPTTDYGTVIAHWIIVAAFVVLLATGLRIASDSPGTEWLAAFDAVLPMEHLWYRHMVAGTVLAAGLTVYSVYLVRARLTQRIRLDRARLSAVKRGGRAAIGAINGVVLWVILAAMATEVVTGAMLFAGTGGMSLDLHLKATWTLLAASGLHVALHAAFGGTRQLLRIVRPSALIIAPPPPDFAELLAEHLSRDDDVSAQKQPETASTAARPTALYAHPFGVALAVGLTVIAASASFEQMTRQNLTVVEIPKALAPTLDGDLSDPAWRRAQPATVTTTQGGDFGGTGESEVTIRALHDGEFAYFAFVWTDPTRSLKHMPLIKTPNGWHVARGNGADASSPVEDKFSVLLAASSLPLIGAAIHLSRAPLSGKPSGRSQRGLHFTDGGIVDVWQWRASHEGTIGYIENCHFEGPAEPTEAAVLNEPANAYTGGFKRDPGPPAWLENIAPPKPGENVHPLRLPSDANIMAAALGRVSDDVGQSESEGSRWWMAERESVPYSKYGDDALPLGTIVPSVLMLDGVKSGRTSIRGVARWAAGRWTLELARRIDTGSPYDLPIKTGTLMWVAAFDHSETRHTRHLRPLQLEVQ